MDNELKNLISKSKNTSLSKKEKDGIRDNLSVFAKQNPGPTTSPYWQNIFFYLKKGPVLTLASLFLITGVLHQTEASLPGDRLYGVKTSFNEEVLGLFTSNPEKKLVWEIRRIEKRLDEVKQLSETKNLNKERLAIAEQKFDEQINNISEQIANLESKNTNDDLKDKTLNHLHNSLASRSQSLNELKEIAGENGKIGLIISKINERLDVVDKEKTKEEMKRDSLASLEILNEKIDKSIENINEEEQKPSKEDLDEITKIARELNENSTLINLKTNTEDKMSMDERTREEADKEIEAKEDEEIDAETKQEEDIEKENTETSNDQEELKNKEKEDKEIEAKEDEEKTKTRIERKEEETNLMATLIDDLENSWENDEAEKFEEELNKMKKLVSEIQSKIQTQLEPESSEDQENKKEK